MVCLVPGKLSPTLAAVPPCGFHLAQKVVVPASVRELPAIHLIIQTHHVLSVRPEPNTATPWTDAFDPVVSFTCSVSLFLSSLTYSLSNTKSCVSYHTLCSTLKSSPALSELTQVCYSLPPCRTHTITIVPISCPCCHYAAAEWDMVQVPLLKENTQMYTYTHFLTKQFLLSLAFSFPLCLIKISQHIFVHALAHKHRCQNSLA